jgi:hypothetical protein
MDSTWISGMTPSIRRQYERTAQKTAKTLVQVLENVENGESISSDFGEVMVSIGSGNALEALFGHEALPLSEVWKPKIRQNEGFDFHTICPARLINFGEAKYSATSNMQSRAIKQAQGFIFNEKHLMDRVYLRDFVPERNIQNLDHDAFGIVAAFSINSEDESRILHNALQSAIEVIDFDEINVIFLVGVSR